MRSPRLGERAIPFARVQVGGSRPIPPPESMPAWWNPRRAGIRFGPLSFTEKLEQFDPNLRVVWNAYSERWQIFMRRDSFQSKVCQGWVLLFVVAYRDGSYMPLDERVFARLYEASADKWGNAKDYWRAVQRDIERTREKREKDSFDESMTMAMDVWKYSQIKNIGSGNKFSTYLS